MAVFLDDEDKKLQDDNSFLSGPVTTSGAETGGNAGAAPKASANSGTPSRFVEFERYFNANAGGANAMADKLGTGVENQIKDAQSNLNKDEDAFADSVRQGVGQAQIKPGPEYGYTVEQGTYSGPKEFLPSENTRSSINNAYSALQNLRSPEGIQASLEQTNTLGGDRFNAALASRAGQERFNSLWDRYHGLNTAVDDSVAGAQTTINEGIDATAENNQAAEAKAKEQTDAVYDFMREQERIGDIADRNLDDENRNNRRNRGPKTKRNLMADYGD